MEDAGERFAKIRLRHSHEHGRRPRRVQQRAEKIEDRPLAALGAKLARRNDVPERRMILGRKEVSEIVPVKRTDGVLRSQIKRNPQRFHYIRTADGRGMSAIAVFGDQHSRRRRNERDRRGDIKRAQPVAAGADDVENFPSANSRIERRLDGFVAQGAGKRGDFAGGFTFLCQRVEESGFDSGRNFLIGKLFHGEMDLHIVERLSGAELLRELFQHGLILKTGAAGSKWKVLTPVRFDESMDRCVKLRNLSCIGAVSTRSSWQTRFMAENRSNHWIKWIIVIVAAGAVITGGIWYFKHGHTDAPEYQTDAVTRGDLTQVVTATGILNPVVNVTVGSQVSGRISKLNVDFNSEVKSNQVIAEIDPSTYQAAVEQSTADLANAKANLELQRVEANRTSDLFTNKLVSGSDYDTAIATLHEAEAMVKIKQASLNNALVNLNYCKIVSPVDGVVISRAVELGQTVASSFNTPTIFQIANDLTKMQIDSSVAEADVGGVKEGQNVDFMVDAYPYRNFHGVVTQVRNAPTTVNNVVTYDCVIGVTNADYKLKPGMTANVSIIIAERENVLIIPNAALRFHPPEGTVVETNAVTQSATNSAAFAGKPGGQGRHGGGRMRGERLVFHTIYVLSGKGEDAKLLAVPVKTGISDGISTEVLSGLDESAQVVTGVAVTGAQAQAPAAANPLRGGFPRMR